MESAAPGPGRKPFWCAVLLQGPPRMGECTSPADGSWSAALLFLQYKATGAFLFCIPSPDFLGPKRWRREKKRKSLKDDERRESLRRTGTTVGEMGRCSVTELGKFQEDSGQTKSLMRLRLTRTPKRLARTGATGLTVGRGRGSERAWLPEMPRGGPPAVCRNVSPVSGAGGGGGHSASAATPPRSGSSPQAPAGLPRGRQVPARRPPPCTTPPPHLHPVPGAWEGPGGAASPRSGTPTHAAREGEKGILRSGRRAPGSPARAAARSVKGPSARLPLPQAVEGAGGVRREAAARGEGARGAPAGEARAAGPQRQGGG